MYSYCQVGHQIYISVKYLILGFALVFGRCSLAQILIHAHNDYANTNPIFDALQNDCFALEVDVILYNNELVISHDDKNLSTKKSFSTYYLKPLINELKEYDKAIVLLIDIKEYSEKLLEVLHHELLPYDRYLMRRKRSDKKSLQVVLSGDIPRKNIVEQEQYCYFFVDGRISDLDYAYSEQYMPWISMDIKEISHWDGCRRPKASDIERLLVVIDKVQQNGKKIRFWNTKDSILMWNTLMALNVDILNTDRPRSLRRYVSEYGL